MFLRLRILKIACVVLIGFLALSGCKSKPPATHAEQKPQETESAAPEPTHKEVGEASWYGPGLQGKETANGETFDQKDLTAAHPSLPMGTKATVTNLENGKKVEVIINDRGPYAEDRVIDLSGAAANKLDMKKDGAVQVKIVTKAKHKKRSVKRKAKSVPAKQ
ncbi:MAG: septal ring lytic transglycosylase RlpA family protein [Methylomonas lenta]|nr:septal ring lytic transglycosylase RlpA family protein [Methylomonas lenta]